jgi:hypothetical protein
LARQFQLAPYLAIFDVSRHIERQHRYRVENVIDPLQQLGCCLLRATNPQFRVWHRFDYQPVAFYAMAYANMRLALPRFQ